MQKRVARLGLAQAGQSLIEVAFATAVVSVVLVGLLTSVTQSMSNSPIALEQTRSTQYAQEVIEWLRQRRDVEGWGTFANNFSAVGANLLYCLPTLPATTEALVGAGTGVCDENGVIPETAYVRELQVESLSATEIRFTVTVDRPGKGGTVTTQYQAVLSDVQ
jgi:type II secretory pathway pseudopilin PulG